MSERIEAIAMFLVDLERLKLVQRRAYVSDFSRRENSAEHSWHLALGLLTIAHELGLQFDLHKALVMGLIHDIGEIDAGDTPAYGPHRPDQYLAEKACIQRLSRTGLKFGPSLEALWLEYEEQNTTEARWVRVMDRLMPFIVNVATNGRNWQEQAVSRSQLLNLNQPVMQHAPELYAWMQAQIDVFVTRGWLRDV